jgi:hypothetical protein
MSYDWRVSPYAPHGSLYLNDQAGHMFNAMPIDGGYVIYRDGAPLRGPDGVICVPRQSLDWATTVVRTDPRSGPDGRSDLWWEE